MMDWTEAAMAAHENGTPGGRWPRYALAVLLGLVPLAALTAGGRTTHGSCSCGAWPGPARDHGNAVVSVHCYRLPGHVPLQ